MFANAQLVGGDAAFERRVAQVVGFVDAPEIGLALPLDIRGTAFQQRVWQALRDIPIGETASYSDIAARIGSPAAVRAVAGPVRRTGWRWRSPVIGWYATTVRCRAIAGEWRAKARC